MRSQSFGVSVRVAITGSHGFIGSALVLQLELTGHEVFRIVRSTTSQSKEISWNLAANEIDSKALEGMDAIVHLAGAGIGDKSWSEARKKLIVESRVQSTDLLVNTLAKLSQKPKVLLSASAVGIYGNRGDEQLTETSEYGNDFLANLCKQWEAACEPARQASIRVVNMRNGIVLGPNGGILKKFLLPFKLGIGGRFGNGKQYMSWITLSDLLAACEFLLDHELEGPVNLVSPNPVTNNEFTKTLGKVLHRPTFLPTPLFPLKIRFGSELVENIVGSQRVVPTKLQASGFKFADPDLGPALQAMLQSGK